MKNAYQFGVDAYKSGMRCIPALDQQFLETHFQNLKVGEGIKFSDQWIKGWMDAKNKKE